MGRHTAPILIRSTKPKRSIVTPLITITSTMTTNSRCGCTTIEGPAGQTKISPSRLSRRRRPRGAPRAGRRCDVGRPLHGAETRFHQQVTCGGWQQITVEPPLHVPLRLRLRLARAWRTELARPTRGVGAASATPQRALPTDHGVVRGVHRSGRITSTRRFLCLLARGVVQPICVA